MVIVSPVCLKDFTGVSSFLVNGLRLYTFKKFEDGIYYRDAELETNPEIKFRLADIPLPNGILRVDKVSFPLTTELRYGHYSLPELESHIVTKEQKAGGYTAYCMDNGAYQTASPFRYSLRSVNSRQRARIYCDFNSERVVE